MAAMRILCLVAVLVALVHAQKGQKGDPLTLLSANTNVFNDQVKVTVTFSECMKGLKGKKVQKALSYGTDTPLGSPKCKKMVNKQQFVCTFKVSKDVSTSQEIEIVLPGNKFMSKKGVRGNAMSNVLKVQYLAPIGSGTIESGATCKNTAGSKNVVLTNSNKVCFRYFFDDNRQIFPMATSNILVMKKKNPVEMELTVKKTEITFKVDAEEGDNFQVTVGAGTVHDILADQNTLAAYKVKAKASAARNLMESSPSSPNCVVTGWSKWSPCSESCVSYTSTFNKVPGVKSRARTVVRPALEGGVACPVLSETTSCTAPVDCLLGSRPYSGETGTECGGLKCSPSNPTAQDPLKEVAGCDCAPGCELKGTCCQAWYSRDCCVGRSCENRYAAFVFKGEFPLVCQQDQCGSDQAIKVAASSNYYCWCDSQCAVDSQCCGGTDSRNNVCASSD